MAKLLTIPYFHNHLTPKNNEHIHMNLLMRRTSPTHQLAFEKIGLYVIWVFIMVGVPRYYLDPTIFVLAAMTEFFLQKMTSHLFLFLKSALLARTTCLHPTHSSVSTYLPGGLTYTFFAYSMRSLG